MSCLADSFPRHDCGKGAGVLQDTLSQQTRTWVPLFSDSHTFSICTLEHKFAKLRFISIFLIRVLLLIFKLYDTYISG